jgi:hypothetical protein
MHAQEMDVLHRNITEALRMHPPLILLLRLVKHPFQVTTSKGQTYTVPKASVWRVFTHVHACFFLLRWSEL